MTKRSPFIYVPIILAVAGLLFIYSALMSRKLWHPAYRVGSCVSFTNSSAEKIVLKIKAVNFEDQSYYSAIENIENKDPMEFEFSRELIEQYADPVACPLFHIKLPEPELFI